MVAKRGKVVWAVDPFEESNETRTHVIAALRRLAETRPIDIEPVYVLSPGELDVMVEFSAPWVKQYKPAAERALATLVKDAGIPGLRTPKVLIHRMPSLTNAVKSLMKYSKQQGAELIVMGTHARKGLKRLIMGSFAESALLYAKIPVLVVGPEAAHIGLNHVLFATDFGPTSETMFKSVVKQASHLGAKLTIFHSITHPVEPVLQTGVYILGGGWVSVPDYLTQREQANEKIALRWIAEAKRLGVKAESVSNPSHKPITESIIDYADATGANVIAMAAESGPAASAFVGSITRQVVRGAHCPVWVLRP